ncbi:hypothetical protein CK203_059072 [Vitis vinifera]|uniref:AP2/ERF domain-containing protein n=1 Tax=Vitis vinifera TaxID=29760 RepID=A0A438GTT4_VITVI|nr:hypothetical protein CK203_059072 [Vitis vinifera]
MAEEASSLHLIHQQLLFDFESFESFVSHVNCPSQTSTSDSSVSTSDIIPLSNYLNLHEDENNPFLLHSSTSAPSGFFQFETKCHKTSTLSHRRLPLSILVPQPTVSQSPVESDSGDIMHYRGVRRRSWGKFARRSETRIGGDRGYGWGHSKPPLKPLEPMIELLSRCVVPKQFSISLLKPIIGLVLTHQRYLAGKGRETSVDSIKLEGRLGGERHGGHIPSPTVNAVITPSLDSIYSTYGLNQMV